MRRIALLVFTLVFAFGFFGCSEDSSDPSGPGGGSGQIDAPTSLTASSKSDTEIELTWTDNSAGTAKSVIDRQIGGAAWEEIASVNAGTVAYTDTDLEEGSVYNYRVKANLDRLYSNYSATVNATTAPKTPSHLNIGRVTSTSVFLQWNDLSQKETGYEIQRKTAIDTEFQQHASVAADDDSFEDTELIVGSTFQYRVRAVLSGVSSGWSDEVTVMTPGPPTGMTAESISENEIVLTWTDNTPNEINFSVDQQLVGTSGWTEIAVPEADIQTYTATGLLEGTVYSFRIKAVLENGESDYSETALTNTLPRAPTDLTSVQDSNNPRQINLTWSDNSANERGFEVQRKSSGDWSTIETVISNTDSYQDDGLEINTTDMYRVRSLMGANDVSTWSAEVSETTLMLLPDAPSGLDVNAIDPYSISITWTDNSGNENGFALERSFERVFRYQVIATLDEDVTSYDDTDLDDEVNYYYRVSAFNDNGWSEYSNVGEIQTPKGPPLAPTNLQGSVASATEIRLSWIDLSDNEDGFTVERSLQANDGFEVLALTATGVSAFNDITVQQLTTYYYRVKSFNDVGESDYTAVVDFTTPLAVPAAPSGLTGVALELDIKLEWTDNAINEDEYYIERRNPDFNWITIGPLDANTSEYLDNQIEPESDYRYSVYARNAAGYSSLSNEVNVTSFGVPPESPSGLEARGTGIVSVKLTWVPGSYNETGFSIERKGAVDGMYSEVGITSGEQYYDDARLEPESTYWYRVSGQNGYGSSGYSDEVSITTLSTFVFADDFEDYDAGSPPDDPPYTPATVNAPSYFEITDVNSHEGQQSFYIYDDTTANSIVWLDIELDAQIENGYISYWMNLDSAGYFSFRMHDWMDYMMSLDIWGPDVNALDAGVITAVDVDRGIFNGWVQIEFYFDKPSRSYDCYVDGEMIFEDFTINTSSEVTTLRVMTWGDPGIAAAELYLDDLLVEHVLEGDDAPQGQSASHNRVSSNVTRVHTTENTSTVR